MSLYLEDLLDDDNEKTSWEVFNNKYPGKSTWLEFRQICAAIPEIWWYLAKSDTCSTEESGYKNIIKLQKSTRYVYQKMIEQNAKDNIFCKFRRFMTEFEYLETGVNLEEYLTLFRNRFKVVKDTKSCNFQYRQLIFVLYPNTILYRWKVMLSDRCEQCGEQQSLVHLFWNCTKTQEIYSYVNSLFGNALSLTYFTVFTLKTIQPITHVANQIILMAKMYIYICKCKNKTPSIYEFKGTIQQTERIEFYNAKSEAMINKHCAKWCVVFPNKIRARLMKQ